MQFSEKIGQIKGWRPLGLAHPRYWLTIKFLSFSPNCWTEGTTMFFFYIQQIISKYTELAPIHALPTEVLDLTRWSSCFERIRSWGVHFLKLSLTNPSIISIKHCNIAQRVTHPVTRSSRKPLSSSDTLSFLDEDSVPWELIGRQNVKGKPLVCSG